MAKLTSFLFCTMIFPVTFGGMISIHSRKVGLVKVFGLFFMLIWLCNLGFAQSKKEETDLCKLKNKMLEVEVAKLDEIVKKQHEENIELKKKIQNHDPKVVKSFEEEFKKAKGALPILFATAQRLEEDKKLREAADIYTSIATYFPGTYEAYLSLQRIPDVVSKIKKR